MDVSQQALLKIAERASTLVERLGNCFVPDEALDNNKLAMSRLKAWCQVVAQSNPEKLAKRLVWDELDSGTIVKVLGAVNRLVRRQTGKTVHQWIVERRMAKACSLLLETNQSMEQIAEAVGYHYAGCLFRQFRISFGTTPQVWRNQHRNQSSTA